MQPLIAITTKIHGTYENLNTIHGQNPCNPDKLIRTTLLIVKSERGRKEERFGYILKYHWGKKMDILIWSYRKD